MIELLILIVFPAAMALGGSMDLFTMTITNKLVLALVAGFFVLAGLIGLPLATVGMHLTAGLAMLILGFALFAVGWIGGGDAKFFAATALWVGWPHLMEYAVWATIAGGVLTLVILQLRRHPLPAPFGRADWAVNLAAPQSGIPYGIALAIAGLAVYPKSVWMAAL